MSSDSSSSVEGADTVSVEIKKKKGVRRPQMYRCEVQKRLRLEGNEYVSTFTGRVVPAKSNLESCSCRRKCTEHFSASDRDICLQNISSRRTKSEQDTFLMGLIECKAPVRKRTKSTTPLKRDHIFTYNVLKGTERVTVCKKAFSILYAIKNKALFRLGSLVVNGQSPIDLRGKHGHRGNALPNEIVNFIDEHINSIPFKESHYCSKTVKYLSAELDIKTLHELFCKKHPDLSTRVKYDFFRKFYNQNHGYRFGRPQIHVSSTCEELDTKIKLPHLNETAKRVAIAEKIVHLGRANKFYQKQKDIAETVKNNPHVGAIVFDYMQNLPLPKIPVQEMFYLRKVWLYVFCVHDIKTGKADFYVYPEGEAKRGPDEVCSLVWLKVQNMSTDIKELHVFSDACGGQNRNNTLVRFFMALVAMGRFEKIYQYFPIRGHSFLQCDRNFGTAKRKIRRTDRIYSPEEYIDLIKTAKHGGYNVTKVSTENVLDFKNWWPKFYKKTAKAFDKATNFTISKYRHIEYSTSPAGYLTASEYIDGFVKHNFLLKKPNTPIPTLPSTAAYSEKVPIKLKKIQDLEKLVSYIPDEHKPFYEELISRPTTGLNFAADDSEGDE